jgi:hypothetical protein
MNLHAIVVGSVAAINPVVACTYKQSVGYSMGPGAVQVPDYAEFYPVSYQIQPLSSSDLRMLDALNVQRAQCKIYMTGNAQGVNRANVKGGDLFVFPDGTVWLVVQPMEQWPDWCGVAVTQQLGS